MTSEKISKKKPYTLKLFLNFSNIRRGVKSRMTCRKIPVENLMKSPSDAAEPNQYQPIYKTTIFGIDSAEKREMLQRS